MSKLKSYSLFLLAALLLAPAPVQAQNKGKGKNNNAQVATEQDYASLAQMKEVVGKLTYVEPTTRTLGIHVEYPKQVLKNPNGNGQNNGNRQQQQQMQRLQRQQNQLNSTMMRQQQQWAREYNNILQMRNPIQQQQRMAQLMAQMQTQQMQDMMRAGNLGAGSVGYNPQNSPYKTVMASMDFELQPVEDVKVAVMKLPIEYDDKGQVVEYTAEELKKKKDKDMPGYTAKFEDLQPGQLVKLYLLKPKKDARKDEKKDAARKDPVKKDDQADANADFLKAAGVKGDAPAAGVKGEGRTEAAENNHPLVRMVLIEAEASQDAQPQNPAPKKKKKNN